MTVPKKVGDAVKLIKLRERNAVLIRAYYNPQEYKTLHDIANHMGLNYHTLKDRLRALRSKSIIGFSRTEKKYTKEELDGLGKLDKGVTADHVEFLNERVLEREARQLMQRSKEQLLQELLSELSRTNIIAKQCEAAIAKLKIRPLTPKVKHDHKNRHSMHLLVSDVQVGQLTDPELVAGLASYSYKDFQRRLNTLLEKVLTFRDLYGPEKMTKLVINFLGDIVEGETIYPGQAFYIDQYAVDQIFNALGHFVAFFKKLAEEFGKIEIFSVWGNHGRVGMKGQSYAKTNFDYIFYRTLKMALETQPNIDMYISESPLMFVKHGDYNFFLFHGDGIPRNYGIPYYGLDRMYQKISGLANMIVNYVLVGHFHRDAAISMPSGRLIVNGCFPGGSLLSASKMFEASVPRQIMFMFHEKRGIHSINDLILDEQPKLEPGPGGVYISSLSGGKK